MVNFLSKIKLVYAIFIGVMQIVLQSFFDYNL